MFAGKGFDTTHTGSYTCFGNDLEQSDLSGIGNVSTTAELFGEVSHLYDTYSLTVFLTKQSHGACFLGIFQIHDLRHYRQRCLNFFIYNSLNSRDLVSCHRLEMSKVKPESSRSHQRTFLFYMRTQYLFQCFLQQMGSTVILAGILSGSLIHSQLYCIAGADHTGNHGSHMTVFAAAQLDGLFYHKGAVFCGDHTGISFLTTHGGIERSLFYKDGSLLTFHQRTNDFRFRGQHSHF